MRPENNRVIDLRNDVWGSQNMNDEMLFQREHEIAAMRRAMVERGIKFCVGPGASLQSVTGKILGPSDEVVLGDFAAADGMSPLERLERAIQRGQVLGRY